MLSGARGLIQLSGLLLAVWPLAAQSKKAEDLALGKILVTTRRAADPLFAKSVIVLVRYGEGGALGLMVNRRSDVPIAQALHELAGAPAHREPVFVGGPVDLGTVFALVRKARKPEGSAPVFGNISLVTEKAPLEKELRGHAGASELRIYLGYCGWGPGQLENEARLGVWYIFDASEERTFDEQPATLWPRLIDEAEALKAQLLFTPTAR